MRPARMESHRSRYLAARGNQRLGKSCTRIYQDEPLHDAVDSGIHYGLCGAGAKKINEREVMERRHSIWPWAWTTNLISWKCCYC